MRAILVLLLGVAVSAGAYVCTARFLGIRDLNPFPSRIVKPAWPLPQTRDPHPLWASFPDLKSPDPERRTTILTALLGLDGAGLPHPALKPGSWNLRLRIQAHALLWRLYRGLAYRVSGIELLLHGPDTPVVAGVPTDLHLSVRKIMGRKLTDFPDDLNPLLAAGARIHVVGRQGMGPVLSPLHPGESMPDSGTPAPGNGRKLLRYGAFERVVFPRAGTCKLVVALDLTGVPLEKVPKGILVSNVLAVNVAKEK